MTDHVITKPKWALVHRGGDTATFHILDAGDVLSTTATVEKFGAYDPAAERMRDFDPLFDIEPIDVNNAEAGRLVALPGVGTTLADAIIAGRPYDESAEMAQVSGVSAGMVSSWGDAVFCGEYTPPPPPPFPRETQIALLSACRWEHEVGGLTLPDGRRIRTTRESQSQLSSAMLAYQSGHLIEPTTWKLESGWVELDATQIADIAAAVSAHIQACFKAEHDVSNALESMLAYWTADVEVMFRDAYAARMA